MKNRYKFTCLTILYSSILTLSSPAYAEAEGQDQIRIETSTPKKLGQSSFSYMVSWRKEESGTGRANGLSFINGTDQKKPTSAVEAAHKLAVALNDAVSYESPSFRGGKAEQPKGKAEFIISNKEGFDFVHATFRDYSNQKLSYNLPGKTFTSAEVTIAIDVVDSSLVDFVHDAKNNDTKIKRAGSITVQIDNEPEIEIITNDKSLVEIEKELATALRADAKFSETFLYPNYVEAKSRNYKPFDGGEVHLFNLPATSISIDINDPSLGVLTKFDFPDYNKPESSFGKTSYLIGLLIAGILGYVFFVRNKKTV